MDKEIFRFKQFEVWQHKCAMKVGTDGVLLGAWAQGGKRILDIGCGTGIIELMMAQRYPEAEIVGIDIVKDCCEQARENADRTPWSDRLHFVNLSLQDYVKSRRLEGELFDAVISNPPFFVDSMKNPDKFRTLARHSDSLPFSTLARGVADLLTQDGVFSVMLTEECYKQFTEEAWFSGLYCIEDVVLKGKANKPPKRHLMKFTKNRNAVMKTSVEVLGNADNSRTEWYNELTKDFYL